MTERTYPPPPVLTDPEMDRPDASVSGFEFVGVSVTGGGTCWTFPAYAHVTRTEDGIVLISIPFRHQSAH